MDSKIVQVALNGLENILRLGEQEAKQCGSGINPYCSLIEEAYGKSAQDSFVECIFGHICVPLLGQQPSQRAVHAQHGKTV